MDKHVGIPLAAVGIGLLAVVCATIGIYNRQKPDMMSDRPSGSVVEQNIPGNATDLSDCTGDEAVCKSEQEADSSKSRAVPRPSAVAADGTTTVTATADATASATATVNVQVQVPLPKTPPTSGPGMPQDLLPFRVCVMEFTTIDTQGKIRFIDPANRELDVAPRCTLNDADRTSVNDVMQGFVRLVDAVENHKTKDVKNAITRGDAIDIWRTVVHGETRPAVIGAEYLEAYLGRNGEVFACLDRPLMVAAMKRLQEDPEFPTDFQLKLAKATGATHLVYGTVGNVTSRENSFTGYGVATKTTNYALDVIVKLVDLVAQQTVYSNTYTGHYREQCPISGEQFDNDIFQSLMKSALQQAADDLYDHCKPGRNNTIRVTPLPGDEDAPASDNRMVAASADGRNGDGGKSQTLGVCMEKCVERTALGGIATKSDIDAIGSSASVAVSGVKNKIGIAEPAVGSQFSKDDALAIWDELEASFHSGEYKLISRAALQQMMTEIGLSTSSDLLSMNSSQKAKLGQLEGIKYLVVPSLRKLGSRITLTLKTVESSTGEVDQERTATLKATSLDEIADKLEAALIDMLSDDKKSKRCALLTPVIKMAQAPKYLQGDFNTWMQSALLSRGVQLANLADVSRFQTAGLTEMTDQDYAVLGRKLRVACLIQFEITDFVIIDVPWASPETGASGHTYSGRFRGRMKVVDANDGSLVDSCPVMYDAFLGKTANGMPPPPVESWAEQVIVKSVMEVIVPRLEQVLQGIKK